MSSSGSVSSSASESGSVSSFLASFVGDRRYGLVKLDDGCWEYEGEEIDWWSLAGGEEKNGPEPLKTVKDEDGDDFYNEEWTDVVNPVKEAIIRKVRVTSKAKVIAKGAFQDCTNLQLVDLSQATALKVIDDGAFDSCESMTLVTPTLPSSLETIGKEAFY